MRLSTAARAVALLLAVAGCRDAEVIPMSFAKSDAGIAIEARGTTGDLLAVYAGSPDRPSYPLGGGGIWTTVNADEPRGGAQPVFQAAFDAEGRVAATIPEASLPAGDTCLQAVTFGGGDKSRPRAVSACVALGGVGAGRTVRSHVAAILFGPALPTVLPLLLLPVVWFALRRIPVSARARRPLRVALVGLAALGILSQRARASLPADVEHMPDQPIPLMPRAAPLSAAPEPDAIDAVTMAGFHDLMRAARQAVPSTGTLRMLASASGGRAARDVWHAAWLLWPRRIEILSPEADPLARTGFVLDVRPAASRPHAGMVFENAAGALLLVTAGTTSR